MSTEQAPAPSAEPKAKKPLPAPLGWLVCGAIAGAAAFGGTRGAIKLGVPAAAAAEHHDSSKPPGPTIALEPFLVQVADAHGKAHPLKMTVAVEYASAIKDDAVKPFTPRIRDAILGHMRSLSFEDVVDSSKSEKLRDDLLKKAKSVGAPSAERVLITDLVTQ